MGPGIAIEPSRLRAGTRHGAGEDADRRRKVSDAIERGGGRVVPVDQAEALVWLDVRGADLLVPVLDAHPAVRWVQLPWAGVETFAASGALERSATFTCAKGSFAEQVAEHALLLSMAALRRVKEHALATSWSWMEPRSLFDARVVVLGGGGIASELVRQLQPFRCKITVLRRDASARVPGADRVATLAALHEVLPSADVVVLALALTPETTGVIGARELAMLRPEAVLVNVARGAHVDTDALVGALASGQLSGVALDVTDPEPLPTGHPLWGMPNALITSHCADAIDYVADRLAARVEANVRNLVAGLPLEGVVDPVAGY